MSKASTVAADRDLVRAVRLGGPASPEAAHLRDVLADQGIGALHGMRQRGALVRELSRLGLVAGTDLSRFDDDFPVLAWLAVNDAIPAFMDRFVLGAEWDPDGGASLRTLFVRGCLYKYADRIRKSDGSKARGREVSASDLLDLEPTPILFAQPTANPEELVVERESLDNLLASVPRRTAHVLLLLASGKSQIHVANELGMSRRTVSREIRSARVALEKRRRQGADRSARVRFVRAWGLQPGDARHVLNIIDECRKYYENPSFGQLFRPISGIAKNRLDFILDGPDQVDHGDRKRWMENGARASRYVLYQIKDAVSSFGRPAGREQIKGLQRDLRELYNALRSVSGPGPLSELRRAPRR